MKNKYLFIGLLAVLFIAGFTVRNYVSPEKTTHERITPTPDTQNAKRIIETFTNGSVTDVTFVSEYDDPVFGGVVAEYRDTEGVGYSIDKATNHVVTYNTIGGTGKIGSSAESKDPSEIEKIGLAFAKKNIIEFEQFAKDAKYVFTQETAPKMNGQYVLSWTGRKPGTTNETKYNFNGKQVTPPPYHSVIILDIYGNITGFQNEYITEALGR